MYCILVTSNKKKLEHTNKGSNFEDLLVANLMVKTDCESDMLFEIQFILNSRNRKNLGDISTFVFTCIHASFVKRREGEARAYVTCIR